MPRVWHRVPAKSDYLWLNNFKMAKIIYLINAFFGIAVGICLFAYVFGYEMPRGRTNVAQWVVGAIVAIAFGVYQLTRYRSAK